MTQLARLDKDSGLRVMCWRPRCSGELAQVSESAGFVVVQMGGGSMPLRERERRRVLTLGPGLRQDDRGRWTYTKYARDRMQQGKAPTFRRPIPRQLDRKLAQARRRVALPAEAECPRCGDFSVLDAETLRVSHSV